MGFEWDVDERAAFDAALTAHLAKQFPGVRFDWLEEHRRLVVLFPDGVSASLWEPNFFFSWPSFSQEYLFSQAAEAIAGQRQALLAQLSNE